MASRKASRIVMVTISVPSGMSGSAAPLVSGADGAFVSFGAGVSGALAAGIAGGGADSADFACCDGLTLLSAALSSPSPRMTAMGVFTATSAVPSGTRIIPSVPSSAASTSMVALSVSISAMMSPDLTLSPSFLSHLARLPFSIVGDSAGMSTSIGMGGTASAINIVIKFGRVRFRIVCGEFGRLVDQVSHLAVNFLQVVLCSKFLFEDTVTCHVDRIVRRAHFVHLLARAIFRRIGHRVAAITVRQHLQNVGPFAGAAPGSGLLARCLHRAHVHAVDLLARNVER